MAPVPEWLSRFNRLLWPAGQAGAGWVGVDGAIIAALLVYIAFARARTRDNAHESLRGGWQRNSTDV